ncbi:hypothetical protein [Pyrolobus fumarii]|uniref:hypothetical protein n=1 Tax=Pyrolobus fumarii TaxID=54252 RepID=UPI001432FC42|nr:hypothetical protein [Pyrolobus fumarii]
MSRKTPDGSYLVPLRNTPEAVKLLENFNGVSVEDAGDVLLVKTRARSVAERIAVLALKKRLLALE